MLLQRDVMWRTRELGDVSDAGEGIAKDELRAREGLRRSEGDQAWEDLPG